MDIGKCDVKFWSPVLFTLALLAIVPSSTGYIDCRISCRRCHKNTEHPAVLEVYCAMCDECKQRRRERMLGRTTKIKEKKKPYPIMRDGIVATTDNEALVMRPQEALQPQEGEQEFQQQFAEQQDTYQQPEQLLAQEQLQAQEPMQPQVTMQPQEPLERQELMQESQELHKAKEPQGPRLSNPPRLSKLRGPQYPYGCPTPPICSDTEDYDANYQEKLAYSGSIPTTTPTMPVTCPPVPSCKTKDDKPEKQSTQHPCAHACPMPAPMCPCYMFLPPGPGMPPQGPVMPPPGPGMPPQGPSMQPYTNNEIVQLAQSVTAPAMTPPSTTVQDYQYVYVGLPKNSMRELVGVL